MQSKELEEQAWKLIETRHAQYNGDVELVEIREEGEEIKEYLDSLSEEQSDDNYGKREINEYFTKTFGRKAEKRNHQIHYRTNKDIKNFLLNGFKPTPLMINDEDDDNEDEY
ncbi:8092_t:CDS:2 [Entrophospora sp. SA101]|nr:8092_t:CDS:2 [Entrophospora sp. SA101]